MKRLRYSLGIITAISGFIHFVSLIVLFIFSDKYGGTADLGKIEAGKFFVGQHGHFVEVTEKVYAFSQWQVNILVVNFSVLCITGIAFWLLGGFRDQSSQEL